MSENFTAKVGIELSADKSGSKQIANQLLRDFQIVEQKMSNMTFLDETKIKTQLTKITKMVNGNLKGIDFSHYTNNMLKALTKGGEEGAKAFKAQLQEAYNIMSQISESKDIGKDLRDSMRELNPSQMEKVISLYKKQQEAQAQAADKYAQSIKRAHEIEAKSLASLSRTKDITSNEKYQKSISDANIGTTAKFLGIDDNSKSVQQDLKEYNKYISMYEILIQKRNELAKSSKTKDLENLVSINKTLFDLQDRISKKETALKSNYGATQSLSSILELPDFDTHTLKQNIQQSVAKYAASASASLQSAFENAKTAFANSVTSMSAANLAKRTEEQSRRTERINTKIQGSQTGQIQGSSENIAESYEVIEHAAENAEAAVENLSQEINSGDSSQATTENDLYAQSLENIKNQFQEVAKYAVDYETALARVKELSKALNSRILTDEESADYVGYAQRILSLDKDLPGSIEDEYYDYADDYKKLVTEVEKMTQAQLAEIQRLKNLPTSQIDVAQIDESLKTKQLSSKQIEQTRDTVQAHLDLDDETGVYSMNDAIVEYNNHLKTTNAYLQTGNALIEERAVLFKKGKQVGDEFISSSETGKVDIGDAVNKYDADTVLHTHPFNESINNLRFSDADIQELLDGTINKAILMCGDEIATMDLEGIDKTQLDSLRNDILGAYTAVFARFGASIDDGKISGIDRLPPEIQNQATDIIHNLMRNILRQYGGDLLFDKISVDGFLDENDNTRIPTIASEEQPVIQKFIDATASNNPIVELQKLQQELKTTQEQAIATGQALNKVFESGSSNKGILDFYREYGIPRNALDEGIDREFMSDELGQYSLKMSELAKDPSKDLELNIAFMQELIPQLEMGIEKAQALQKHLNNLASIESYQENDAIFSDQNKKSQLRQEYDLLMEIFDTPESNFSSANQDLLEIEQGLQEVEQQAKHTESAVNDVINRVEQLEHNAVTAPTSIDTDTEFKKIEDSLDNEAQTVDDVINEEASKLDILKQAVNDVTEAVETKTQAFKTEQEVVESSVLAETGALETLENKLTSIKEVKQEVSKEPIKIEVEEIPVETKQTENNSTEKTANKKSGQSQKQIERQQKINSAIANAESAITTRLNSPALANLEGVSARVKAKFEELNQELKDGDITLASYNSAVNKMVASLDKADDSANTVEQAIEKMKQAAIEMGASIHDIKVDKELGKVTASFTDANKELITVEQRFDSVTGTISKRIKSRGKEIGNFSKMLSGWKGKIGDMVRYFASFGSVYEVLNVFKQGFTIIRDLDTELTEMAKVSDENLNTLKAYQQESFGIAQSIGSTGQQIQASTADWMRLGEAIDQAKESAKASNILYNVSEFDSIDAATESLVAMSQAYSDVDKMDIIDKMNNIGNNYSIATDGVATALQKSASALLTAGNSIDESIALITAGNAVVQNPDSVGAGLRTIALRITGTEAAKAQLEELGEDTSDFMVQTSAKSQQAILDFTKVASNNFKGFDILDNNGNFKSTYEILLGISEIYDEIVATDKQLGTNMANGLLETLAGKNRANIAASILQNPELLKSVYSDSQNSAGSALKENEKYLESINGHIDQLKNKWQELWSGTASRDSINMIIDLGSALLDVVNTIGVLPSTGILGALFGTFYFHEKTFPAIGTALD